MATDALDLQELLREAPPRLSVLLRTLADNRFKVHVAGLEEARLIEGIQKVANRITAGVIAAAMIVGASMIMRIRTDHQIFGYPALALIMFVIAVGLGAAGHRLARHGSTHEAQRAQGSVVKNGAGTIFPVVG